MNSGQPSTETADAELAELRASGLLRELRTLEGGGPQVTLHGRSLLNFSSNDYLGLSRHPRVIDALTEGVRLHGAGAGASRLVCGTSSPHTELERALARFKATEASLAFTSGYAAALGTLSGLCGPADVIILDKLCHASLIDGARLSNARLRVFAHNRPDQLRQRLQWARRTGARRILVATESVFSMDGDLAPLREMAEATAEAGAWLLVDEAHALGVIGPDGRGLAAALGLTAAVTLHLGTLSKAAGLSGGFVAGPRPLIDLLINRARPLIYSTAPPPALAHAAAVVFAEILPSPEGRSLRDRLWERIRQFTTACGLPPAPSAIIPLILGEEKQALEVSARLQEAGFLIPAIRHPTVPRGQARLRITLSAAHEPEQVDALASSLHPIIAGTP